MLVLDVSNSIEMVLPLPVDDIKYLSQSVAKNIVEDERYIKSFEEDIDVVCTSIGRLRIQLMTQDNPIDQLLTLIVNMEVSILHGNRADF